MNHAERSGREILALAIGWIDERVRRLRASCVGPTPHMTGLDDAALQQQLERIARSGRRRLGAPICLVRPLATLLEVIGKHQLAARLWVLSLRSDPDDSERWLGLARCLQRTGGPGPTLVTTLGWTLAATASTASLDFALQRAGHLGAGETVVIATQRALHDQRPNRALDLSAEAIERSPSDASAWIARARTLATHAQLAGGLMPDDVVAVGEAWERATTLRGMDARRARVHLVRHSIRFGQWERAFAAADPNAPTMAASIEEVRSRIDDASFTPAADWWYVAWWRMQSAGHSQEGRQARRREAESRLPERLSPAGSIATIRAGIQTLVILDRLDEALDLAQRACRVPDRGGVVHRLRADVLLRTGDPLALADWARSHSTGLPSAAERSFADLVRGRRVSVVGPHATDESRRRLEETSDVIIDTKRLTACDGSSTSRHISYYADTTAALFAESVGAQLANDDLDLAVLRPSAAGLDLAKHPKVRIAPTEDSLSLGVSHFAIARIVYDLLRYSPRSISLVAVDLFTSPATYPQPYQDDRQRYIDSGFAPVLPRFNHDVADDFLMLSRLNQCGLLDADEKTQRLLGASLDDYLSMVDRAAQASVET